MKAEQKTQLKKAIDLLDEGAQTLETLYFGLEAEQMVKSERALESEKGQADADMIAEMGDINIELSVDIDALKKYLGK